MSFLSKVLALVEKDFRAEFRTKEMLSVMLIFALLVVVIFGFAFNPTSQVTRKIFPGILWVAFFFAGVLGLNHSFTRERYNQALHGLMIAPVDRSALYFSKVLSNMAFMLIVELVATPVFLVFFDYSPAGRLPGLVSVVLLATFGFVAVGTFLAALAANTRTSQILLPILLFPVVVPVVIAAVQLTAATLAGSSTASFAAWLRVLVVYDIIFLVVPFLLFDYLLEV